MKKFIEVLRAQIPFELKRTSSLFSIVIALVFSGFFVGLGAKLLDILYQFLTPHFPLIIKWFVNVFSYSFNLKINLITVTFFIITFFTLYRAMDRTILSKLKNTKVFFDDFNFSNKGWELNYWGTINPDKTCRYESSFLVFEAHERDLIDSRKEYGAYYDLVSGIYEKDKYEISCMIKADKGTTMGIKLWAHDTKGNNEVKYPANFYIPGETPEEIKIGFTGSSSQALRIHLHIKGGAGKIYVDSVQVVKK